MNTKPLWEINRETFEEVTRRIEDFSRETLDLRPAWKAAARAVANEAIRRYEARLDVIAGPGVTLPGFE